MQQGVKRLRPEEITRVFIGGLSYSTDWQSLKDYFSQVGEVEFASVLTTPDGKSKGCGMVNYHTHEEAVVAVAQLNESLLDGRHIMVKLDVAGDYSKRPSVQGVQSRPMVQGVPSSGANVMAEAAALLLKTLGRSSRTAAVPRPTQSQQEGVRLPPEQISRIFIGNLSYTTNWQALKDHFKQAGTVEFASILETPAGASKGVGLVNYATHDEAINAVAMLNETELDGRMISVKLDVDGHYKERPPPKSQQSLEERVVQSLQQQAAQRSMHDQRQPEATDYFSLPPDQISRVFVGNLAYTTNWQALKDHFGVVAEVDFASVLLNPDRTSKGCGMVNFKTHEDAARAVELLNNSQLDDRQISVKLDVNGHFKERPPPGARPRVHQLSKDQVSQGGRPGGHQLQNSMTSLTQILQSPQTNTSDALNALGALASQRHLAGQIDWPRLITSLSQSVTGQAQRMPSQPMPSQRVPSQPGRNYYGKHR